MNKRLLVTLTAVVAAMFALTASQAFRGATEHGARAGGCSDHPDSKRHDPHGIARHHRTRVHPY